jgi:hypothetical protein
MATVWNCIAYLRHRFIWKQYGLVLYISFFSLAITWATGTGTSRSPGTNCQIPASFTAGMYIICGDLTCTSKFMHLSLINVSGSFSNELLRRNDKMWAVCPFETTSTKPNLMGEWTQQVISFPQQKICSAIIVRQNIQKVFNFYSLE